MHLTKLLLTLGCFLTAFVGATQVCKPAVTVFFDVDADKMTEKESYRLDSLIQTMDTTKDYRMEIYAYTDSTASSRYNDGLSKRRGEGISSYLLTNYTKGFESVQVFPKGETVDNSHLPEELQLRLNRRAEIILFEMKNGKMTLTGGRGTLLEIDPEYFKDCPVCKEDGTKIREIRSNQEAEELAMEMATVGGNRLVTGGMMRFDFECENLPDCFPATIRIPANEIDTNMNIWISNPDSLNGVWYRGSNNMKFENGFYLLEIPCFRPDLIYNVDYDVSIGNKIELPFLTSGLIIRTKSQSKISWTRSNIDTIAYFEYASFNPPMYAKHQGEALGLKFSFDDKVLRRHWEDTTSNSAIRIPIEDYEIEVLHNDNNTRVRMPWNATRDLDLYVTKIDSLYDAKIGITSQKQRDYNFHSTQAEYQIYACNKKTGICGVIPPEGIRKRFRGGSKQTRIKLKRSAIRNLSE